MFTTRPPALVLGVPSVALPFGQVTPRCTRMRPLRRSTSNRRSSAIWPYLSARQAPNRTAGLSLSGIAVVIVASSSSVAISTVCARSVWPPPSMAHGFSTISFALVALVNTARSSW